MTGTRTQFVAPQDFAEWRRLFQGYADFYKVSINDEIADTVWRWLLNPDHDMEGLIAFDSENRAVGIAHVRRCPRPLGGCEIGFLDDLFVVPEARGGGVADALFQALKALAAERNWSTIRWLTQDFNERGRAFYDRYTDGPTPFIMYQWKQDPPSDS